MNQQDEKQIKIPYFLFKQAKNEGFTLIELLVVVIILGILASLALPNYLKQTGKAREVELKNAVGAVNRAQQAYHFENQRFVQGADDLASLKNLGLSIDNKYIDDNNYNIVSTSINSATIAPVNAQYQLDGTRAYSGGTYYSGGFYKTIVCHSADVASDISAPTVSFTPVFSADCGTNVVLE